MPKYIKLFRLSVGMEMAMKLSGKTGMGTKCYYWNGKEVVWEREEMGIKILLPHTSSGWLA